MEKYSTCFFFFWSSTRSVSLSKREWTKSSRVWKNRLHERNNSCIQEQQEEYFSPCFLTEIRPKRNQACFQGPIILKWGQTALAFPYHLQKAHPWETHHLPQHKQDKLMFWSKWRLKPKTSFILRSPLSSLFTFFLSFCRSLCVSLHVGLPSLVYVFRHDLFAQSNPNKHTVPMRSLCFHTTRTRSPKKERKGNETSLFLLCLFLIKNKMGNKNLCSFEQIPAGFGCLRIIPFASALDSIITLASHKRQLTRYGLH